jgi:hypothetical protein
VVLPLRFPTVIRGAMVGVDHSCINPKRACFMDANRFDALSRSLTDARSRRAALASLLGGTFGVVGLTVTTAKKKCPPCKKRKDGKCKKKKPDGSTCAGGTCHGGHCVTASPPPAPTCNDGIKNGSETDIDCGGSCARCARGQGCATPNDCASAFCGSGTCQTCTTAWASCGGDANGPCRCRPPKSGAAVVCTKGFGLSVDDCLMCQPGTFASLIRSFRVTSATDPVEDVVMAALPATSTASAVAAVAHRTPFSAARCACLRREDGVVRTQTAPRVITTKNARAPAIPPAASVPARTRAARVATATLGNRV